MITDAMKKEIEKFLSGKTLHDIHGTHYEDLTEQNVMDLYRAIQYTDDLVSRYFPEVMTNRNAKSRKKQLLKKTLSYWLRYRRDEKDPCEFLEEHLDTYRFKGTDNKDKLTFLYGEERGLDLYEQKREKMRGENNPGYQHGGKLSPFSREFVGYQDKSDEEKDQEIKETAKRSQRTRDINSTNKLKPEYWMCHHGYTYEEAVEKISELQNTRSLESFIERYGEEEGYRKFNETIEKWMDSFWHQKSSQEKKDIVLGKRKGTEGSRNVDPSEPATLYFAKLYLKNGDKLYKIGKSRRTIDKRVKDLNHSEDIQDVEIISTYEDQYQDVTEVEDTFVEHFWDKNVLLDERYKDFNLHKVETFDLSDEEVQECQQLIGELASK